MTLRRPTQGTGVIEDPTVGARLDEARCPEDLFGRLLGNALERSELLEGTYQMLLERAPEEKARLDKIYEEARLALLRGVYGRPQIPVLLRQLRGAGGNYTLLQRLEIDDSIEHWAALSDAGDEVLLHLALDDMGNALLKQEAFALRHLTGPRVVEGRLRAYVPALSESFNTGANQRLVNVFAPFDNLVDLAEVRVAYPDGVPALDAIWILKRLLVAIGFGHVNGLVNASVLPENVLIHPHEHGLVLADWAHSSKIGKQKNGFSGGPEWCPIEIAASQCPLPASDIYLAARCMQYVLGATPGDWRLPSTVPANLSAFLASLVAHSPQARPDDAWALVTELDELVGPRKFRPLVLPPKASDSDQTVLQQTQPTRGSDDNG